LWVRHGLSLAEKIERYSIPEPNSGCLLWMGAIAHGYGQVRHGAARLMAHRASYELERGPIPDGLVLDHLCRNKACINPRHLEPVTNGENVLRGFWKSTGKNVRNSFRCGHPLVPSNLYRYGGSRVCRICNKNAVLKWQRRRRRARLSAELAVIAAAASAAAFNTPPTPRQLRVLAHYAEHIDKHGWGPSFGEVARAFGFRSDSSITYFLAALERRGLLARVRGRHGALAVTDLGRAALAASRLAAESSPNNQNEVSR
jgi:DNA-binding MarR family transcriptional regulator